MLTRTEQTPHAPTRAASMSRRRRRTSSGFTLIELLVTLVVTVILASVAYPTYQSHVFRSRRTEAIGRLLALQQAQEQWRGSHSAYAGASELSLGKPARGDLYQLDVIDVGITSYTLVASAIGIQAADKGCAELRLTVSGGQTSTASYSQSSSASVPASVLNTEAMNRRCWNT